MNLVSLESVKIFCDVVRQRSFSRAAAISEISQSAASQAVLQIEKRLGVRLLDRSKRPFTLTPEGEEYYEECRDLLDRYLALEARIRTRHDEVAYRVNVAAIYSIVLYRMNQYVRRFVRYHAQGHVRFQYLHPDDVYESVLRDQADLGLLSFPRSGRELEIIPWRDEPMVLVCPPGHSFAQMEQVTVGQLGGVEFVAFAPDLAIRREIDRFLQAHGVTVSVVMAFDNIEFIKRGIETAAGVSILPEPAVESEVRSGSLKVVPVPELDLVRPLCIIHRRKRVMTPAMVSFIAILQEGETEERQGASANAAATVEKR